MKRVLVLLLCCALVFGLGSCANPQPEPEEELEGTVGDERVPVESSLLQFQPASESSITATVYTSRGNIELILYPGEAPLAVHNFYRLAKSGYYEGTQFHRVVPGFVVQGGDATGTGNSGESAWGTPFAAEASDDLFHFAGALCMAADADRQNTSQFYIVTAPQGNIDDIAAAQLTSAGLPSEVVDTYKAAGGLPYLDNTDTVFGQVVKGLDIADEIALVPTDEQAKPLEPVTILRVEVHGYWE